MKRIEELGISQSPWHVGETENDRIYNRNDYAIATAHDFCLDVVKEYANARLIAAAPELYECLREAVVESCFAYCGENHTVCQKKDGECFVQKWRAALSKAAGEEVAK